MQKDYLQLSKQSVPFLERRRSREERSIVAQVQLHSLRRIQVRVLPTRNRLRLRTRDPRAEVSVHALQGQVLLVHDHMQTKRLLLGP